MELLSSLVSDSLILRKLEKNDASERYLSWLSDPDINRYLEVRFAPPRTVDELARFIETNNNDSCLMLGIWLRTDRRHIGNIKLGLVDRHHDSAEIGLLIGDKSEWGKGHGSVAINLVAEYAFSRLSIAKLTAGCYADNEGSRRAFLNAGFVEEGRRIAQWLVEGKRQDGVLLGKVNPYLNY